MKRMALTLLQALLFFSCSSTSQNNYSSIRGFDLSEDNQYVYYSFIAEKQSSIRRYDLGSGMDTVLLQSATNEFHTQPQLSPDNSKLAFIESSKNDFFDSRIGVLDISSSEVEYLPNPKGIISSILYSTFSENIYFLLAQEYEHYSPIGVDAAHKFDLYSINLLTKETIRLTSEEAYSMYNLIELDSSHISFFMQDGKREGLFSLDLNHQHKLKKMVPKNDARTDFVVYGKNNKPVYGYHAYDSESNLMALACAYELFVMNKSERVAKSIFVSLGHYADIRFFNKGENKILFTKVKNPYFYVLDMSDSSVNKFTVLDPK